MRGNSTANTIDVGLRVGFVAEHLFYGQLLMRFLVLNLNSSTLKRLRGVLHPALALETASPTVTNPLLPSEK